MQIEKSTGHRWRQKEHMGRSKEKLRAVRFVLKMSVTKTTLLASVVHIHN